MIDLETREDSFASTKVTEVLEGSVLQEASLAEAQKFNVMIKPIF
jgi:hypothetical protein